MHVWLNYMSGKSLENDGHNVEMLVTGEKSE